MAIELKQNLKLSQQLVITPQLQQAIKLLQLSRIELAEVVREELLENPILEEAPGSDEDEAPIGATSEVEAEAGEEAYQANNTTEEVVAQDGNLKEPKDFEWENYMNTFNDAGGGLKSYSGSDEAPIYENVATKGGSLKDHLEWQLRMNQVTDSEEESALVLIDYLDDNGYLSESLEVIAEKEGLSVDELDDALSLIQDFDPTGVGARNLEECLLLQCRFFKEDKPHIEKLIKEHLNLLERRDYPTIAKKMKLPVSRVAELAKMIGEMEPKPGRPFGKSDTQYITPDVYIYKVGEDFVIVLNEDGLPRLRLNSVYKDMAAKQEKASEAKDYMQDKLKSAQWLIRSIHQRQRTLYRVSKCIVAFQKEFFEHGISHLKPMILRDVAEEIGVHESTVSRATTNKFMHTPHGIFELKFFFNAGLSCTTGVDVASEAVKDKVKHLVSQEDPKKPLSDKEIAEILCKENINVARRTIAKYRELLGILPSSRRRQLY